MKLRRHAVCTEKATEFPVVGVQLIWPYLKWLACADAVAKISVTNAEARMRMCMVVVLLNVLNYR